MDTTGNIIDKLFTVNLKLSHNSDEKRLNNLNIQKKSLMDEIDVSINKIFKHELNESDILRPQHKTY
jgi:hypothetical protein